MLDDHTNLDQLCIDDLDKVSIHPDMKNHKVQVSARLRPDLHLALIDSLM